MKKKLFAILMTLTLVLSYTPAIAFADNGGDTQGENVYFEFEYPGHDFDYGDAEYYGHYIWSDEDGVRVDIADGDKLTINDVTYTYDGEDDAPGWYNKSDLNDHIDVSVYLNNPPQTYDPKKFYDCTAYVTVYNEDESDSVSYEITKAGTTDTPLQCRVDWYCINGTTEDNIYYSVNYQTKSATAFPVELNDEDKGISYAKPGKLLDYVTVPAGKYPVTSVYFCGCTELKTITLPATIDHLYTYDLIDTGLTSITIPATVKEIDDHSVGFTRKLVGDADEYIVVPGFVIYGKTGSAAQAYANRSGIKFVDKDAEAAAAKAKADAEAKAKADAEAKAKAAAAVKPSVPADKITITKTPSGVKAKAAKKGKATLTWKKFKQTKKTKAIWKRIKKVEVQYSTDKTFRTGVISKNLGKKKTKLNVKKLKAKKTYYFRVRYVEGPYKVSKWSAVKKVKAKK